jgi:hypothetical protein
VPGYTFRVWVTNRSEAPGEIWRAYNGQATVEQRIEEIKSDDGFCTKAFFATEAAFLAVLFAYNLMALYQGQVSPALAAANPPPSGPPCSLPEPSSGEPATRGCCASRKPGAASSNIRPLSTLPYTSPCPSRRFWLPASSGLLLPLRFAILAMQRAATLQLNRGFRVKNKKELTVAPK